jgi:hypothetical protein
MAHSLTDLLAMKEVICDGSRMHSHCHKKPPVLTQRHKKPPIFTSCSSGRDVGDVEEIERHAHSQMDMKGSVHCHFRCRLRLLASSGRLQEGSSVNSGLAVAMLQTPVPLVPQERWNFCSVSSLPTLSL